MILKLHQALLNRTTLRRNINTRQAESLPCI